MAKSTLGCPHGLDDAHRRLQQTTNPVERDALKRMLFACHYLSDECTWNQIPIKIRPLTVALCDVRARGNTTRRWLHA